MFPTEDELNSGKVTVGKLIDYLSQFSRDTQVGLSSDDEGNSYSPWIYPSEHNNLLILYPSGMHELEDFEDYEDDDDEEEEPDESLVTA